MPPSSQPVHLHYHSPLHLANAPPRQAQLILDSLLHHPRWPPANTPSSPTVLHNVEHFIPLSSRRPYDCHRYVGPLELRSGRHRHEDAKWYKKRPAMGVENGGRSLPINITT